MSNKVQGQGYFRKSKAFGLVCGITLATAFFGGQVSADEVTTTAEPSTELKTTLNPATNLEAAQGENSQGNKDLQNQANSQNGILKEQITNSDLDKSVDTAKKEGVEVSNGKEKEFSNLPDANKELERQKQEVEAATQKARDNEAKIKEAEAKNAEIDAKNKAEAEKINKENEQAKAAIDAENAKLLEEANKANEIQRQRAEEIHTENQTIMNAAGLKYTRDWATDKAAVDAYNANREARTTVTGDLTAWNSAVAAAKDSLPISNTGYTASGSSTNLKPVTLKNGIEVVSNSRVLDTNSTSVIFKGDVNEANIVKDVSWEAQIEGAVRDVRVGDSSDIWGNVYNYRTANQIKVVNTGKWYKIPNLITTADNKKHDGYVMFEKNPTGLNPEYQNNEVVIWNDSGAINAMDGAANSKGAGDSIRTYISIDRPNNANDNIIWLALISDIDAGQFIADYYNQNGQLLAVGGGLKVENNKLYSDENLGITYGVGRNPENALDGYHSSPDGSALMVQTGVFTYNLNNSPGGEGYAVARADFGAEAAIVKNYIKTTVKPEIMIHKPEYNPILPTRKPFTPKTPNVEDTVVVPEKENVSVTVNPVFVKQTPKNEKDVVNTDNVSVNGKLVAKGSTQKWVLKHESMKAGRPETQKITIEDFMADGFELDVEATKKENQQYATFTYGEDGKLTAEYNKSVVDEVNKDKTKDYNLPVLYLVGKPMNDGGTYVNTFKTTFATAKGSYTVTSNTPVIYTPGNDPENPRKTPNGEDPTPNDSLITPSKDVVDEKGNSINGKTVLPNTVLNYEAIQKLSQYQGMEASKEAIGKGFIYIDDPDENSLDTKSLEVKSITASNGDDVKELLQMYHVLSMDTLDEKLQEIVKNSGISPVGEFYMWVAKNPEEFYKAYVQKGLDITYNLSFKIREDFTEGQIKNQTFQIDFGNGYYSNVVVNDLPKLEVHKEVLDKEGGKSINNSEVKLNDELTYRLEGWVIPTNRSYDLFEYKFVDQLQNTHDSYVKDRVVAKVNFKLSDGTEFKEGDDLTEYTELKFNKETGLYERAFKEEFLKKIPRDSEFGADAFIVAKRIQTGEVNNEYTLYVNGNPVKSEIVTTRTPEPPKPETPTPKQLPKTGETNTASMSLLGLGLLGAMGATTLRKRKED